MKHIVYYKSAVEHNVVLVTW